MPSLYISNVSLDRYEPYNLDDRACYSCMGFADVIVPEDGGGDIRLCERCFKTLNVIDQYYIDFLIPYRFPEPEDASAHALRRLQLINVLEAVHLRRHRHMEMPGLILLIRDMLKYGEPSGEGMSLVFRTFSTFLEAAEVGIDGQSRFDYYSTILGLIATRLKSRSPDGTRINATEALRTLIFDETGVTL